MAFEEKFGIEIPDDAAETIQTVQNAIDYIESKNNFLIIKNEKSRCYRNRFAIFYWCRKRKYLDQSPCW